MWRLLYGDKRNVRELQRIYRQLKKLGTYEDPLIIMALDYGVLDEVERFFFVTPNQYAENKTAQSTSRN